MDEIGDVRYVVALNKSTVFLLLGCLCLIGAFGWFSEAFALRLIESEDD